LETSGKIALFQHASSSTKISMVLTYVPFPGFDSVDDKKMKKKKLSAALNSTVYENARFSYLPAIVQQSAFCMRWGSMLEFSAIFAKFRRKDWRFFLKKQCYYAFLSKLTVVLSKMGQLFHQIVFENTYKIIHRPRVVLYWQKIFLESSRLVLKGTSVTTFVFERLLKGKSGLILFTRP
jgi:hypothetical protein